MSPHGRGKLVRVPRQQQYVTVMVNLYRDHTPEAYIYDWYLFYRPYGRIDFRINLPMRPLLWVIGAFSLHQERGLAFAEYPVRVSTC